jgi:uncharacterized protein HemX
VSAPLNESGAPHDEIVAPIDERAASEQGPPPRRSETIGTGSALGFGCLLLMLVLILAVVVFRWGGVSW